MSIYYQDEHVTLYHGDCLERLSALPDASVDAIVTDPPYGLSNTTPAQVADTITQWVTGNREYLPTGRGFMGHEWDGFVPPVAVWDECLRVLKPGGHLLAFAGSRTHDLMTLGIRLAGFEIRDSVAWLYGSGFPKSMDVSKAIDKGSGVNRDRQLEFTAWMRSTGITSAQINAATDSNMGGHYLTDASQPAIATADMLDKLRPLLPEVPEHIERLVAERTGIEWTDYVKREVIGQGKSGKTYGMGGLRGVETSTGAYDVTTAATDLAKRYEGFGTALKPAFEPVTLARKPLTGTVAANVLEHGTGALNIDGCRVSLNGESAPRGSGAGSSASIYSQVSGSGGNGGNTTPSAGRWPANVALDESQAAELDRQSGTRTSGQPGTRRRAHSTTSMTGTLGELGRVETGYGDSGGASRFFYVAKAPKSERPVVDGTAHPTVKPLALMEWLVRMVTPPGGTVLDPFAGSGTTLEAAAREGFSCIGIERQDEYLPLIHHRIQRAKHDHHEASAQGVLPFEEGSAA